MSDSEYICRMISSRNAEENDVDLLLDMKLDIILNNELTLKMNKNELEKTVLEAEEQIRENIQDYQIILENAKEIGLVCIVDYGEAKLIDTIYIIQEYRNKGIGTYTIKEIIKNNYKPIYLWVDKINEILIKLCKNVGFIIEEDLENRYYMKYENNKEENRKIKAKMLCKEVSKLCEKYKMEYFFYTEGESISNIRGINLVEKINQYVGGK